MSLNSPKQRNMSLLHHYDDDQDDEELSWEEEVDRIWEDSLSMNEARQRIEELEFGDIGHYANH